MNKKYLAVLGRELEISLAELMALYGNVRRAGANVALVETDKTVSIDRLGGTMKLGQVLDMDPVKFLRELPKGKITLGVSDYRARTDKNLGLKLKRQVGRSVRVVPGKDGVISTATAHHNQLGEKQNHIELAYFDGGVASVQPQNITAYARRDQARPARDAKVGMLPPKLAQVLINMCGLLPDGSRVLDAFCGTGVVLQEALLMGYSAYGTDLSERMAEYTKKNLEWLCGKQVSELLCNWSVEQGDATSFKWKSPIDAVVSEVYLGSPLSLPPPEMRLKELKAETGEIFIKFLRNIGPQLEQRTPLSLAIPAWRRPDGSYSRLNVLDEVKELGYNVVKFSNLGDLLYYREGQVVAREIIVLRKI